MTAHEWIRRRMGQAAWDKIWGPLLRGKFGSRAEDISAAWLWKKLVLRRQVKGQDIGSEHLGYPRHSWELLFERLVASIEGGGGRVLIDRPVVRVERDLAVSFGAPGSFRRGHDPSAFDVAGSERYDRVLSTLPNDVMLGVAGHLLSDDYRRRLESIEYHTAVCLLLEIDRQFSPYYWTNIADPQVEFVGLVEHTNLVEPERYGRPPLPLPRQLRRAGPRAAGARCRRSARPLRALAAPHQPRLRPLLDPRRAGSSGSPPPSRSSPSATSA